MNVRFKKRNIGLDVLRTTAILFVLFSHTLWIGDNYPNWVMAGMQLSGTIGVEIFFVISGFLIGKIVLREINRNDYAFKDLRYFLVRRWFRTFPNYYLLLMVNVLVWYLIYKELPQNLYKYFIYIQNFSDTSLPFYRVSWSLAVEQFSYVIGPLLLYIGILLFPKQSRNRLFVLVTILILTAFSLTRVHFYYNNEIENIFEWNESIRKVLIYRLDAIYWGFLLRYVFNYYFEWFTVKRRKLLLIVGLSLLFLLNVVRPLSGISADNYPGFMIVFYLPIHSIGIAMLIPYMVIMEMKSKLWMNFFYTISIISYSIYLLHYTIILHSLKTIIPSEELTGVYLWLYTFFYWGITLLLSYLLYRYFEKPLTDLRDHKKVKRFFGVG